MYNQPAGLYMHVPFCRRKCPYCDFYSIPENAAQLEAYSLAVCRNLRHYGDATLIDTVYFGGGTPSLLTAEQVQTILSCVTDCFTIQDPEITMEVNPATVTVQQLSAYRQAGVNRLSIGVQSLIPKELKLLGRLHTADEAVQTVQAAVKAGFSNLSCDIMIGTPGQTMDSLTETLTRLTALPIQHISAYLLKIEPETPFARQHMEQQTADDDLAADLYLQTVRFLTACGFEQYEVSNFAKLGFRSRHNCKYWQCTPYLGIGPSAHSCWNGKRFYVKRNLDEFLTDSVQQEQPEDASPCDKKEQIMLGMRLIDGMPLTIFSPKQRQSIQRFCNMGFLRINEQQRAAFTPEGFLVSNAILAELL